MSLTADRERLYGILEELAQRVGGYRYLRTTRRSAGWPDRGVYFFLEGIDPNSEDTELRVVRIGTHALKEGSKTTLWNRLSQHQGTRVGSRPGGGAHRGSVFRKHVGKAILTRDDYPEAIRASWGVGNKADRQTRDLEHPLELAVSRYIANLPFLWVGVGDLPGPSSDRGKIERNAIGLLSEVGRTADRRHPQAWLGDLAASEAIRDSGLWNVNHTKNAYESSFLDILQLYVERM